MNLQTNQKGFTIVELLIVIVVIAILAAISIVAYTGIQNNARSSAAQSAAASVRDAAEAFNAVHGSYPANKAAFVDGVPSSGATEPALSKLPSDITFKGTTAPAATQSSPKEVRVIPRHQSSSNTTIVGFTIEYWNYKDSTIGTVTVGDVSSAGTVDATAFSN